MPDIAVAQFTSERVSSHGYTQRMRRAAMLSLDSSATVLRLVGKLDEDLDEATPVHGVPTTGLAENDSLVTAVGELIGKAVNGHNKP